MLKLICVPLGGSASRKMFDEAAALPFEETVLVTADRELERQARERRVQAVTFDNLARMILHQSGRSGKAGPKSSTGVKLISRRTQELIIATILSKLVEYNGLSYFRGLAEREGFLQALTSLIGQLGRSGATVEEVETVFANWEDRPAAYQLKDREVAAVYRAYRSYLKLHGLYDVEGLYRLASVALASEEASWPWRQVYFYGFYHFEALEIALIERLSKICQVTVGLVYEADRPELFQALEATYASLAALGSSERLDAAGERVPVLKFLAANWLRPGVHYPLGGEKEAQVAGEPLPNAGSLKPDPLPVRVWQLTDQVEEMRQVMRDIKSKLLAGEKAASIAIVVRQMADYNGLDNWCAEYGIPSRLPRTAVLAGLPLTEYLLLFLQAAAGQGRRQTEAVQRFLTSPLQELWFGLQPGVFAGLTKDFYYREAATFWQAALELDPSGQAAQLREAIQAVPAKATVEEYCTRAAEFLAGLQVALKAGTCYRQSNLSLAALQSLLGAEQKLQSLLKTLPGEYQDGGLAAKKIPLTDFVKLLEEAAAETQVTLATGNTEGIAILAATTLEDLQFKHVYILGLRENEFPSLKTENWLYDDRERGTLRSLGLDLPGSLSSLAEDAYFFATACAAATSSLTCTYYEDERQGVSVFVKQLQEIFGQGIRQEPDRMQEAGHALSPGELGGFLAAAGGELPEWLLPQTASRAASADKLRVLQPEYNGVLGDTQLRQQVQDRIGCDFSAAKLETYYSCPFSFLAAYVWRQNLEPEAQEGLEPSAQGTLLHKTLENFMKRQLKAGLRPEQRERYLQELEEDFTAACEDMIRAGKISDSEFWPADRQDLWEELKRWLEAELAYAAAWAYRPEAVEAAFGGRGQGQPALKLAVPTEQGLKNITVQGRIDRLEAQEHKYFISDYKNSKAPAQKEFLHSDLQLPLYLTAAQAVLRQKDPLAQVVGGGYYILRSGVRLNNFVLAEYAGEMPFKSYAACQEGKIATLAELEQQVKLTVGGLISRMDGGNFTAEEAKGCSRFCPAADICRCRLNAQAEEASENA